MSYISRSGRGASKASTSTLCQKCLQRGHYSYECKFSTQERPYVSRPSRSQQFNNPRLRPQLTNSAPDASSDKKGLADGILAKKAAERSSKRHSDDIDVDGPARKRSRSVSSYSTASISTISTRSSRSPSPRLVRPSDDNAQVRPTTISGNKRRRRTSSVSSGEMGTKREDGMQDIRNTRPRKRSISPGDRGRAVHRSSSLDERPTEQAHSKSPDRDRSRKGERPTHRVSSDRMNGFGGRNERSMSPYSRRAMLARTNGGR